MKRSDLMLSMAAALALLAFALGYLLAAATLPNELHMTAISCDGRFSIEEIVPLRRYD